MQLSLIQTRPQQFKLDGANKLYFYTDLEIPESRVEKGQSHFRYCIENLFCKLL